MKRVGIVIIAMFCLAGETLMAGTAALTITPANQLPGLPFEVTITIRNDSSQPLIIDAAMILRGRTSNGATWFIGHPGTRGHVARVLERERVDSEVQRLTVNPGAVITLVPSRNGSLSPFVGDPQFLTPGQYRISAEIEAWWSGSPAVLRTPEVDYIVTEPEGDDREVWQKLQAFVLDSGIDDKLWFYAGDAYYSVSQYVFENARDSSYTPYLVDNHLENKRSAIERVEAAIRRWPDLPVTDRNRLLSMQLSLDLLAEVNAQERHALVSSIQRHAAVLAGSPDPSVRQAAALRSARCEVSAGDGRTDVP